MGIKTFESFYKEVPAAILKWYDENARILPWRESKDPYRIWISEIMLQQTQVKTVLPYFQKFIQVLPDIKDLAAADEDVLLKLWEGLGYYNRVRNMQKAAYMIMNEHGGRFPESFEEMKQLPGIGDYSAGAISSIAFGLRRPAVDGNVLRVFSRILGSFEDITSGLIKKEFQGIALEIQPEDRPGDFNQALMELGATVCLPNGTPLCAKCPVAGWCRALSEGTIGQIPVKAAKAERKTEQRTVLIILSESKLLLHKRSEKGLLAGMYEPLNLEGWLDEKEISLFLTEIGLNLRSIVDVADARHLFTHIEWNMKGFLIEVAETALPENYCWVEKTTLNNEHAMPSAFKSYFKYFKDSTEKREKER